MKKFLVYISTIFRLGIFSVAYVIWYRFSIKSGLRKWWFKKKEFEIRQVFFYETKLKSKFLEKWKKQIIFDGDNIVTGQIHYYSHHWKQIGSPPDWFLNPFNGNRYPNPNLHWTKLPDFHPKVGDIKNIWEASRFDWVVTLARAYFVSGADIYINTLNTWLKDWVEKNPLNIGPNWKCGQEASIRVFNLLTASLILNQWGKPTVELSKLIYLHLERIFGNIRYAIAQNNNHGTSEATALFIGGCWLHNNTPGSFIMAEKYERKGRHWLENRVNKLVAENGSFSQHSVTYHRVMLDTLCFAEYWRKKLKTSTLSADFYKKARRTVKWLWLMTDEISGDAPNLGANDGSLLLNMHSCNYRDFRPSIQLGYILFEHKRMFDDGPWNEIMLWLGIDSNDYPLSEGKRESIILDKAYCVIRSLHSWAVVRLPCFKFRPTQNDVFHFDLWFKGENVLCDSGSFSYNPDKGFNEVDLRSVHSHNTLSFDHQEQMPRISRFLLAQWINPLFIEPIVLATEEEGYWLGAYMNYKGNTHQRRVIWDAYSWVIHDKFYGQAETVVIGFNFYTEKFSLDSYKQTLDLHWGVITIDGEAEIFIEKKIISKYYFHSTLVNRLVIKTNNNSEIKTKIKLA